MGRPLVCGDPQPPKCVLEIAASLSAPVTLLGRDYTVETVGEQVRLRVQDAWLDLPLPVLRGAHQVNNAATGLAAVLTLLPEAAARTEDLARGLAAVNLKGRFDKVAENPDVWIDVGHNPLGAEVIAQALRERGAGEGRRIRCVLAMLGDKDAETVAAELSPVVSEWYCAGLSGERGQSGQQLASRIGTVVPRDRLAVYATVTDALSAALDDSDSQDGVLVFGSFYTADEADRMMLNSERTTGARG